MKSIEEDQFDQEVVTAIKDFPEPLPDGVEWIDHGIDFDSPEVNPDGETLSIAEGVQDTYIAEYWLCAWMDSYVDAGENGDKAAQDESLEYISRFTSLPSSQKYMGNPETFDEVLVGQARLGDSTRLRAYFNGPSCRQWFGEDSK